LKAEQLNIKRSKRWNGEIASLTPAYLKEVAGRMEAYGDRVRFALNGTGAEPEYQVINAFEKKMAFDSRHHLLRADEEAFSDVNATRILSLEQVRNLIAHAGMPATGVARTVRKSTVRSATGKPVTAARKMEENIDALKYAYFKEHSATLPEEIKAHSQEITQLMKTGLSAEEAFNRILAEHF